MVLNRRLIRNLKKNVSFYLSIIILNMLIVGLFIGFQSSSTSMYSSIKNFKKDYKVEDANFTTLMPLENKDINKLNKKFNTTIENQQYCDAKFKKNTTIRIFKENKKINKYQLLSGKKINSDNKILLDSYISKVKNLKIGDKIHICNKNYTIAGYFAKPDYIYPIKSDLDLMSDRDNFGIAILNNKAYKDLKNTKNKIFYSVRFSKNNEDAFQKYVDKNYGIITYNSSNNNLRIINVTNEMDQLRTIGTIISIFLTVLTIVFMCVIISRKIKSQFKDIGTLFALGYKKRELILHYLNYTIITGLVGCVLGLLLGIFLVYPIELNEQQHYNLPIINNTYNPYLLIISFLIPLLILLITSIIVVKRSLNRNVVSLLTGVSSEKVKITKATFKNMSFSFAFKFRQITRNIPRTLMFLIGIFISSILILSGFVIKDSINRIVTDDVACNNNYKYVYYLNDLKTKPIKNGDEFFSKDFEYHKNSFSLIGLDNNEHSLKINDLNGKKIKLNTTKAYISKPLSVKLNVQAGDYLKIKDTTTLKKYKIKIKGIANENAFSCIYIQRSSLNHLLNVDKNSYNGVYSNKKLNLNSHDIFLSNKKQDLIKTYNTIIDQFQSLVVVFVAFAAIIAFIVIYVVTSMVVEENSRNISMLKILGYKPKEIYKLVLNTNTFLIVISYALSIPCALYLINILYKMVVTSLGIYITSYIKPINFVFSFLILVVVYEISLTSTKHKVGKISMVESLKER